MASTVALDLIALHRLTVARGNPATVGPIGAAPGSRLPADAIEQIEGYIGNLDRRDELEGSRAVAGWFDPAEPDELGALRAATSVAEFERASLGAMNRLARLARGNATSGVVLFIREGGVGGRLVCLKLDPGPLTRTRIDPGAQAAATAFDVARLRDVLPEPRDLKKGAVLPSPGGADVRVVDLTKAGDPAGYWVDFLGAVGIRAADTASNLVTASVRALELEQVPPPRARELVARHWTSTTTATAPVTADAFVRDLARDAGVDATRTWGHVTEARADLADPHAVVAPAIAKKLKRIVDLGDGVRVSGPAAEVDQRIEEGQDEAGWFVKVRATRQPGYETG
jgi:hypothetical protein